MEGKKERIIASIVIIVLVLGAFWAGNSLNKKEIAAQSPGNVEFDDFWKAWNIINERYVDNDDVPVQEKVWGAISGLADSLGDPYTVFLPPQEAELFEGNISGNFGGIGVEIGIRDDVLTAIAPLKDSPAEKAGVKAGDKIIAVDGELTTGLNIDESVLKIRGEVGTKVTLTLTREGRSGGFDVDIVRNVIKIPTIETELQDNGVFIIRLFNFSAISPNEFRDALRSFIQDGGQDKLILDLRGNPGGFLNAAVDIASWFLAPGKVVVTEDYGKNGDDVVHRSKGYNIFNNNLKFAILVDQGSASASEILAGALQDYGRAIIVGSQTFGKGSVQELLDITNETSLKVTVAKWLTPLGNSISDGGITPDVEVELTIEDFEAGLDPQLDKAVEVLLN